MGAMQKPERFADALAKLEEIKQKFDHKYLPEGLEQRIADVKARKDVHGL
jgi:hypothetical protein